MSQRNWIIVAVVVVILLAACACAAGTLAFGLGLANFSFGTVGVSETIGVSLVVDTPANITIHNDVGRVTVRTGEGNRVEVQATKQARSRSSEDAQRLLASIDVVANSTGNEAQIRATTPNNLGGESVSVDLDIRIPQQATLDISAGVGEVSVDGTEGGLTIEIGVGKIVIGNVRLLASSRINTGVGEIRFDGQLPAQGEVSMTTRTGAITVRLPADSEFMLNTHTGVGEINSGFALQDRQTGGPESVVSKTLRGRVGSNPSVTLSLDTGTGRIDIEQ